MYSEFGLLSVCKGSSGCPDYDVEAVHLEFVRSYRKGKIV